MKRMILLIIVFSFMATISFCETEADIKRYLNSATNEELLAIYNRGKEILDRNPSLRSKRSKKEDIRNLTDQELDDLIDIKKAEMAGQIYNKRLAQQNMTQGVLKALGDLGDNLIQRGAQSQKEKYTIKDEYGLPMGSVEKDNL